MCKLGLIDFIKQCGRVELHPQGSLSDQMYNDLRGAVSTIKNAIKNEYYRVDIYDANNLPDGKTAYYNGYPDNVYVQIQDLLYDRNNAQKEFYIKDKHNEEPLIRQIYAFLDEVRYGGLDRRIERLKSVTLYRYKHQ